MDDRLRAVRAVVFDVGETLVDEAADYGAWADWLGIPRHTFSAVFGVIIAAGGDHRDVFAFFRPGVDLDAEWRLRVQAGQTLDISARDLYPDAVPSLTALRRRGYRVGIAGNQPARAGQALRNLRLPADFIATSAEWESRKPAAGFFGKADLVLHGLDELADRLPGPPQ